MLRLALRNLVRRPLRLSLTLAGLAFAVAILASLSALETGYRRSLRLEFERMGLDLMLVPLGCPYDAAARVVKGRTLENSLPASALEEARQDPAVAVAAPLLIATMPRPEENRSDVWVGLDESSLPLKPWWRTQSGASWFPDANSTILGSTAAEVEMRAPGDLLFCPETGRTLRVAGVLHRSGLSDDSLFFVPLTTAQEMFNQNGRLTAVAIRLKDPALFSEAARRLQAIPGAQVVTLTEMLGTFLNLVGAVRTLCRSVALIAVTVSVLGVLNTMLAAVVERAGELSLLRAVGASRRQVFQLLAAEALLLTGVGSAAGLLLTAGTGRLIEAWVRRFVSLAPEETMLQITGATLWQSLAIGLAAGLVAGLYPAWRASRTQPARVLK